MNPTNRKGYTMKFIAIALLALTGAACAPRAGIPNPTPPAIQEDDPGWNCLTMGNRICGPEWVPVPQDLGDALAEGDAPDATTRDWESCLTNDLDRVVCPDGYTESW